MGDEDPDKYYPYPTKGVQYSTPPSAVNFAGQSKSQYDGEYDFGELADNEYLPDAMDLDNDGDDDSGKHGGNVSLVDPSLELNQGTFGVELEFLLVQCPRVTQDEDEELVVDDPHPNEARWFSTKIAEWEILCLEAHEETGELYGLQGRNGTFHDPDDWQLELKRCKYSRAKLTRILRDRGLVVTKWIDPEIDGLYATFVSPNEFSESEDSDDEREEGYPNRRFLGNFSSTYVYDYSQTDSQNYESAVNKWQFDYGRYHEANNLREYRTRPTDITDLTNNACTTQGWPNLTNDLLQNLRDLCAARLEQRRLQLKQTREDERNVQVDPLHVPVPGLSQQYKAWTATVDYSVDGNGMTANRYANPRNNDPIHDYLWFGAEVVSPVLQMGDERAREAIRVACGALRDKLRCHKPMEVSTGLHVHLGHTQGWTLFQAKRFATLWFLIEKTILALHRKDRDADRKWCAKIGEGSRLWRALYSPSQRDRNEFASVLRTNIPQAEQQARWGEMGLNVPMSSTNMTPAQRTLLQYLWLYDTIDALHEGLGETLDIRTGLKWRIRGREHAHPSNSARDGQPCTIEARIMQGTLDADHINNWVVVLEHITHVVRDWSNDDFRAFLEQFLSNQTRDGLLRLLRVPDDVRHYWMELKRRDAQDLYWEYPDKDVVDWNSPFMVPGHKATHGAFWD